MEIKNLRSVKNPERIREYYVDYINEVGEYITYLNNEYDPPYWWWETDDNIDCWVFINKEDIVGFSITENTSRVDQEDDIVIREFYIHPKYRRQGYAFRLLKFTINQLSGKVWFQVYKDNNPAISYWNYSLRKLKIDYHTSESFDGNIPVIGFNFTI